MGRSLSSIRNQINEFKLQKIKNKQTIVQNNSIITSVTTVNSSSVPTKTVNNTSSSYKRFQLFDPSNRKPTEQNFNLFRDVTNTKKGRRVAHITTVKTIYTAKKQVKNTIPLLVRQSQIFVGLELHIKDAYNNISNIKDVQVNGGLLKNRRINWNVSNNVLKIVWEDWRKPINLTNIDNIIKNNIPLSYDPSLLFNIVLKDDRIPFLGVIMYNSKCVFKNNDEKVDYYFLKL